MPTPTRWPAEDLFTIRILELRLMFDTADEIYRLIMLDEDPQLEPGRTRHPWIPTSLN